MGKQLNSSMRKLWLINHWLPLIWLIIYIYIKPLISKPSLRGGWLVDEPMTLGAREGREAP